MRDIERALRESLSARAETYRPADVDAAERRFLERRSRHRIFRAGAAVAFAGAAAVGLFALIQPEVVRDDPIRPAPAPAALRIADRLDVADEPLALSVSPGAVWIASRQAGVVSRIDTETGDIEEMKLSGASQVAADGEITWAAGIDRIARFDDATGQPAGEYLDTLIIDVPVAPAVDMAVGGRARGGAWAVGSTGCVADLQDLRNRVCVEPDGFHATDVATGPAETWLLDGDTGDLHQLHAEPGVNDGRGVIDGEAPVPTAPPGRYADLLISTVEGRDLLWASGEGGQLLQLDLASGDSMSSNWADNEYQGDYLDLAEGYGGVWALIGHEGSDRGEVVRLDVETGEPRGVAVALSGKPSDIAAGPSGVWVTLRNSNEVVQIAGPGN